MIKIEGSPASILVPVQWEDARPLVNCRKNSRQDAKAQRRIGKGWAPTNNAKMLGRRRQKTDAPLRFSVSLCAPFASWREILSSRKTLLGAIGSLSLCQHRSRALAQHRSSPTAVGLILEAGRKAGQPPRPDRRPRSMIVPLQKILIADSFPSRADRRSPNPPLEYPV